MLATSWLCALSSFLIALANASAAVAPPATTPCKVKGDNFPAIKLEKIASGFQNPVGLVWPWVVEQAGLIRNAKGDILLDIRSRVRSGGELGLLSVAFHPKDAKRFYVNYTTGRGGNLRTEVVEFSPKGERLLLRVPQPYTNHNGGQLAFGPDGRLYVGMGDGGSGNDPENHAQRNDSLLGKMLTLDVDKKNSKPEVFAKGLRNPWRFSFDPVTGKLWAGDVGQDKLEEIDVVEKGGNYGWRVMEGDACTPGVGDDCDPSKYKAPVHVYGRDDGISITGGFVYRGAKIPGLCGAYLFSDYGTGYVWGLRLAPKRHARLLDTGLNVTTFGVDSQHEVYLASPEGDVYKLVPR